MTAVVTLRRLALVATILSAGWAAELMPLQIRGPYMVSEFRLEGVPQTDNPFDPDQVKVDVVFRSPSGVERRIPAFWFQDFESKLIKNQEQLTPIGEPHWRVRFSAVEAGEHAAIVEIVLNQSNTNKAGPFFFAIPKESAGKLQFFGRPQGGPFLVRQDGTPLPLVGHCVCWHHEGGTEDYVKWLNQMANAGENYTRVWMAPWAFGIETEPQSLTNYRLDRAWQLDRVFGLALERGIYVMLCLDYHGMFEQQPDYWGGNNYWPKNPYNAVNGGPCKTQDEFFTSFEAERIYRKRLRYMIGRYAPFANLLAWQFFNEIDNVYRYLVPEHVAKWHERNAEWLRQNDPYGHLITTSLTGNSIRPEIWQIEALDLVCYHSYGQHDPVIHLPAIVRTLREQFEKPVMIAEFGTDWRGWNREQDPLLRGWRQGIWAGALSGSVGTAMSWWWESIHTENLYSNYLILRQLLLKAGWGDPKLRPIPIPSPSRPPTLIGDRLENGSRFEVLLKPDPRWGSMVPGSLGLGSPQAALFAPDSFNAFVHGTAHPDIRRPFWFYAWFDQGAKVIVHVNSVSEGAILSVLVDGGEVFRRPLPNVDGQSIVNAEYDLDISVIIPEGKHRVEIRNAGLDWFYVDWVRVEGLLPASYQPDWTLAPFACGLQAADKIMVYMINPMVSYPNNSSQIEPPLYTTGTILISNVVDGVWQVHWSDPRTGMEVLSEQLETKSGTLRLAAPAFREELFGFARPVRTTLGQPRLLPDENLFILPVSSDSVEEVNNPFRN